MYILLKVIIVYLFLCSEWFYVDADFIDIFDSNETAFFLPKLLVATHFLDRISWYWDSIFPLV